MAAISDSSPLILFGRTHRLDILQQVFAEIIIPPAVRHEVLPLAPHFPAPRL